MSDTALLIARILLALIFILAGFSKLADAGTIDNAFSTAGMIAAKGLPMPVALAYLAGLFEMLGGVAILVGFQTRIVSYLLAAFCVVSGLMFHLGGQDMMAVINQIMLMKNLAIAGGFIALAHAGAGSISVDARTATV